jgi:hypothetical protein
MPTGLRAHPSPGPPPLRRRGAPDIVPIVMSRTCTPHSLTHIIITSLFNPRNDPNDRSSQTPTATLPVSYPAYIYTYVQWLHYVLHIYHRQI